MKQTLLSLILLLAGILPSSAQKMCQFNGMVKDIANSIMANAIIYVKAKDLEFSLQTNQQGIFGASFGTEDDSLTVVCSALGYKTQIRKVAATKDIRADFTMHNTGILLREVTVEGATRLVKEDNVTYIPSKRQVNGANSGVGLLFNLMIPQLDVNRITGEVKAEGNSEVAFYIDGRKTSKDEVDALRPKDIKAVEYHHTPSGLFASEQKVLNYITRKYNYGGYVDLRTDTRFINQSGSYSVLASFDKKTMNYMLTAGAGYAKSTNAQTERTTVYTIPETFSKQSNSYTGTLKSNSQYVSLRAKYNKDNTNAMIQGGLSWSNSPASATYSALQYSTDKYASNAATGTSDSRSVSSFANGYLYKKLSAGSTLNGNINFNYSHNKYNSMYAENATLPITSNTKEDYYSLRASLKFNKDFNKNHSMGLFLWTGNANTHTLYAGTNVNDQQINDFFIQFLPTYGYKIPGKLTLNIQPGIGMESYKVSGKGSVTVFTPRPMLSANYIIDKKQNIYVSGAVGTNSPNMSVFNNTEQTVSEYEVMRGNPDLDISTMFGGMAVYNFYVKNFSMSAYVDYTGWYNCVKDFYTNFNNKLLHTFVSDGNYHNIDFMVGATSYLLNKSLQIKANAGLNRVIITGMNSARNSRFSGSVSAAYFTGNLTFTGYFKPQSTMLSESSAFYKNINSYGITASWGYNGWYAEAGCQNILGGRKWQDAWLNYGAYRYNSRSISDALGGMVYIKLSYNFDFGRKTKHENMDINTDINSAIMKVER